MDVLWFNGTWTTTDEPVVRVEDRGFQFGDAIYEVLRFRRRAPVLTGLHHGRLVRCLSMLDIPLPWTPTAFDELLRGLIGRTRFDDGLIYLQVTRGVAQRQHLWSGDMEPTALAYTRSFTFPSEARLEEGVAVITTPENRWRRRDLKTTNLLGNVLAKREAAKAGAAEVVYVDGDDTTECASSSLVAVVAGRLVTHEDDESVLPGTLRDAVLELARREGIAVERRAVTLSELLSADELFITSTSQGVMPVASVDGESRRSRGPVTLLLQRRYELLEREEIAAWLRA